MNTWKKYYRGIIHITRYQLVLMLLLDREIKSFLNQLCQLMGTLPMDSAWEGELIFRMNNTSYIQDHFFFFSACLLMVCWEHDALLIPRTQDLCIYLGKPPKSEFPKSSCKSLSAHFNQWATRFPSVDIGNQWMGSAALVPLFTIIDYLTSAVFLIYLWGCLTVWWFYFDKVLFIYL